MSEMRRGIRTPRQQAGPGANLGIGQQEIAALVSLVGRKSFVEAESRARKMTDGFPQFGFGWKALGEILRQTGRHAEALACTRKAAALLPDDAEAQHNLGVALLDLGQFEGAAASSRRALEINPEYANAHGNLGNALVELGRMALTLAIIDDRGVE